MSNRLPIFEEFDPGYEMPEETKKHRVFHDTRMIRWWGDPRQMVVVHKDRINHRVDNIFYPEKVERFKNFFKEADWRGERVDVECSYAFASVIEIIDVIEQQAAHIGGYLSHDYGLSVPASTGDEDWDYYLGQEDFELIIEKLMWPSVYRETEAFFSKHRLDIVKYGKSPELIKELWKDTPYHDDEEDMEAFDVWMNFQLEMLEGIKKGEGDLGNIDIQIRDSNHRLKAAIAAGEEYVCIEIFEEHLQNPKIIETINKDKEIEFVKR